MAYLESDFCSRSEYEDGRESRLTLPQENELYLCLFALVSPNNATQAAKLPAEVVRLDENRFKAILTCMDMDLRPVGTMQVSLRDGYLADLEDYSIGTEELPIEEGYLRQYGTGLEADFLIAASGLQEVALAR